MSSLTNKWPRIALPAATLALLVLIIVGGANSSAAPSQQTPIPPSPQPTRIPQTAKPILLTDPVPDPKQQGVLWFAPTGHTLRGAFLDYWQKNGGLAQFGYPITEEFTEQWAGTKPLDVQYFERNRFEHHKENKGTQYEVLLGTLGLDFRQADPPATPQPNATYFQETGHNLFGTFKQYWDTHGGLFVHGFPITEPVQEQNPTDHKTYTVQYFERSRFELHPENDGSPYQMLLGLLGVQLSQRKGYPNGWYPLLGHAADFSWISGIMYNTPPYMLPCRTVPPTLHSADYSVTPMGPMTTSNGLFRGGMQIAIFGHIASPAETPQSTCGFDAPPYIVEYAQTNPVN